MCILVSVLIPVFNEQSSVSRALSSVLGQTYRDFEVLVVDDGSTDDTTSIVSSFSDKRIRLIRKPTNSGIVASLNLGLSLARGEYVARLDGDDVARPERLAKQVAWMDGHPDAGLVGSWAMLHDLAHHEDRICAPPIFHKELVAYMHHENPFIHSSVLFRTGLARQLGGYVDTYRWSEDYALWILMASHMQVANIPEILVERYENNNSSTHPIYAGFSRRRRYASLLRLQLQAARVLGWTWSAPIVMARTGLLWLVGWPGGSRMHP